MASFLIRYVKHPLGAAKRAWDGLLQKGQLILAGVKKTFKYQRALQFHRYYIARFRAAALVRRYGGIMALLLLISATVGTIFIAPSVLAHLSTYFDDQERVAVLRTLLITVGGSLIGAAAIVMSLVMFAMQVNIERTPHRLFRRLSADFRLLGAFATAFLLSFVVAGMGLVLEPSWMAYAISIGVWGTVLILVLFLYAYRRALRLINPMEQLKIIAESGSRHLKKWARRADRAAPLFPEIPNHELMGSTHQVARVAYFRANPHWTNEARDEVSQAISYSRRYAEQGDYEVSVRALSAIVFVNANYLAAKGRTFFGNQLLFDYPLTTDGFINHTLEQIRQNVRIAISRGDEQQIEQNLRTLAELTKLYLSIDYSVEGASKTHAVISAGYLADAVRDVLPVTMPNVLMEGVRLMGTSTLAFMTHGRSEDASTLIDAIKMLSAVCVRKEELRPVTLTGLEQVRDLSLAVLQMRSGHASRVAEGLAQSAGFIAGAMCKTQEAQDAFRQNFFLAPYYGSGLESFPAKLTDLCNRIMEADEESEAAKNAIYNIAEWSEELDASAKSLLLLWSQLTFDVINWIASVAKILFALTKAATCSAEQRRHLVTSGLGLVSTLSWVERDRETVKFVEGYQFTEVLFRIAADAQNYIGADDSRDCSELLISWTFDAGQHQIGRAILERATYALISLALMSNNEAATVFLKHEYKWRLEASSIDQEQRARTARAIRKKAGSIGQGYTHSSIESTLSQLDRKAASVLLKALADILAPLA